MEGNNSTTSFAKAPYAQSQTEASSRQTSAPSTPKSASTSPFHKGEQPLDGQEEQIPEESNEEDENGNANGNGASLERAPSKENRMGKKQIAVIMIALSVRSVLLLKRESEKDANDYLVGSLSGSVGYGIRGGDLLF